MSSSSVSTARSPRRPREFAALLPEGNLGDAYVKMVEDADVQLSADAKAAFERVCGAHAFRRSTDPESRGEPSIACRDCTSGNMVAEARYFDLIVTAGGASHTSDLVMGCGRPVVLAPARARDAINRTVAIAWKETAEAARAVTSAMPLLLKSERVVVIAANEGDGPSRIADSAARLVTQLGWHGTRAEARPILSEVRDVPEAILGEANDVGADLLVMGAYGHSRLTEFVFGGVTRHVLNNDTLPVLMFH